MKTMKKFLIYVLLIIAFWIFSDIIIYVAINGTYKDIEAKAVVNSPEIIISESKATYVNGYVKGSIKNNTQAIINDKYLKIDLYSARDVNLGTKYVKIDNLAPNKNRDFEMWYKFTDVEYANISVIDNVVNSSQEEFLSQKLTTILLVKTLLVLYFL